MADVDRELRHLMEQAAGTPRVSNRAALLDTLVARIEAGGADVADAPEPGPMLSVVDPLPGVGSEAPTIGRAARNTARAAGIGMLGWVAIAVGSTAAAVGAWLIVETVTDPAPEPTVAPSESPIVRADAPIDPSSVPGVAPTRPGTDGASGDEGAGPNIAEENASANGDTAEGADPGAGGASGGAVQDAIDDVASAVDDAVEDVEEAVEDLLPEPVADTLAPAIGSINVNSLVGSLLCDASSQATVSITDDVGVTSASLRVTVGGAVTATVPLTHGSGSTWTANVASPLGLLDMGKLVTVRVEAHDAAGNVATKSASVTAVLSLAAC